MLRALLNAALVLERQVLAFLKIFAWANVVLIAVTLLQIILRHLVSGGHQVILGELEWHLYAVAIFFGLSYSQLVNAHVRVDAVSRLFSARARHYIEIFGITVLMMPFLAIMFVQGLDYVATAWRVQEHSSSPVGLPYRWIIKSIIPIGMATLFVTLAIRLVKDLAALAGITPEENDDFAAGMGGGFPPATIDDVKSMEDKTA